MKFPFLLLSCLCLGAMSCKGSKDSKGSQEDKDSQDGKESTDISESIPTHTADTHVNTYTGSFLYGSNMGRRNEHWKDEDIADVLIGNEGRGWAGVGVNSLRPSLPEYFVETWGYDNRVNTFRYYSQRGAQHNVLFIGDGPCAQHYEKRQYVPGANSQSYENLYEPIWIESKDGKAVNENNYYAWYVYNVIQRYKDHVKFWEIKNEPDFTASPCGWAGPGSECNWWDRNPLPEELSNFHAPIQSYIRMLRISYEVIKSVDSEAYICVGGIGYESFLDAVLRNTDNPDNGKVAGRYPLKGGAWFDCLSFHIYPMYSLRRWEGNGWNHFRHSDAAVAAAETQTKAYVELLKKYGYGKEYPSKEMIVTETNVPSKRIGESIGSEEAQRNYLMKWAIVGQRQNIRGIYPFSVWDSEEADAEGGEYAFMGFYKPLPVLPEGPLRLHESGEGWRTTRRHLGERSYDEAETRRLALSADLDGGAFYSARTKDYVYALWAKTTQDLSEAASAPYGFPSAMNVQEMTVTDWRENQSTVLGDTVSLGGTPLFIQIK